MSSQIFSKGEVFESVVDFSPKSLDPRRSDMATDFVQDNKVEVNDFEISPLVAEQSGVAEVAREKLIEEINAKVHEKYEAIKEEGRKAGYEQGLKEGIQEIFKTHEGDILDKIQKIQSISESFDHLKLDLLKQSEHQVIELVYHLANELASKEISEKPEGIHALLQNMVESVQKDEKIKIYIHPEDAAFIKAGEQLTGQSKNYANVTFVEDEKITRGGAQLETNFVELDATLEARAKKIWDSLSKSLPDISSHSIDLQTASEDTSKDKDSTPSDDSGDSDES